MFLPAIIHEPKASPGGGVGFRAGDGVVTAAGEGGWFGAGAVAVCDVYLIGGFARIPFRGAMASESGWCIGEGGRDWRWREMSRMAGLQITARARTVRDGDERCDRTG